MRHSETDWIILSTSRTFPDPFSFATPLETRFRDEPFFLPRKRRIYFETMFKKRGMAFSLFSRVSYKGEKSCSGTNDSIAGSLAAGNLTLKWRRSVRCSGNRKSRTNATFFWWFVLSWIMRFRIGGWAAEDVSLDAYCFFFFDPCCKTEGEKLLFLFLLFKVSILFVSEILLVINPVYFSTSNPISTRWRNFSLSLSLSSFGQTSFFFSIRFRRFRGPWIPRVPLDSHSSSPSRHSS